MALQLLFQWLKTHREILEIVFCIAMIFIIVLVTRDQFTVTLGSQLREVFVDTSMYVNATVMALGLVASSVMGLYDLTASKYAGVEVSSREVSKTGWVAQAFNNFVGFGGLTGGMIRAKYYTWTSVGRDKSIGVSASVWVANLLELFILLAITLPYAVYFDGWLIIAAMISCMHLPLSFLANRLKRFLRF